MSLGVFFIRENATRHFNQNRNSSASFEEEVKIGFCSSLWFAAKLPFAARRRRSASPTPTLPIRISIGEQRDRMEFFHHWHKTHIFCKHIHFAADWSQIRSVEQRWSDTFLSLSPNPCQPCRLIERRRRCKGGQIDRDWFCVAFLLPAHCLSLSDNLHVTFWLPFHSCPPSPSYTAMPDVLTFRHEPSNPPYLFILFWVFWGSEKQTSLSLPLLWVTHNAAQPPISPMITSGVPSVQWNPTLAVRDVTRLLMLCAEPRHQLWRLWCAGPLQQTALQSDSAMCCHLLGTVCS